MDYNQMNWSLGGRESTVHHIKCQDTLYKFAKICTNTSVGLSNKSSTKGDTVYTDVLSYYYSIANRL